MRKLNLADTFRFSAMVEAAGARDIVNAGLKQGAEEARKKRETLLRLKRALDEAKEPAERDDIMRQLMAAQKDDSGLYRVGIDTVMQVMSAAAGKNVERALYDFLAPVLEMTPEAVAEMPLEELAPLLGQIAKDNLLKDFFRLPGQTQAS